jgi:Fe-S cluster biosynthesis and repair protein YggX
VAQITCARCGQQKEQLAAPPLAGERGVKVHERVCAECWQAWLDQSTLLINHYGIQVADPAQRRQLYPIMAEFLNLKDLA